MQGKVPVDVYHPLGGRQQDAARRVLGHRADRQGAKALLFSEKRKFPVVVQRRAVVVGADPQPVPGIHVQTRDAGQDRGRIHVIKLVAVIADQTAIAADPDESVVRLGNCVCFIGGKPAAVIV